MTIPFEYEGTDWVQVAPSEMFGLNTELASSIANLDCNIEDGAIIAHYADLIGDATARIGVPGMRGADGVAFPTPIWNVIVDGLEEVMDAATGSGDQCTVAATNLGEIVTRLHDLEAEYNLARAPSSDSKLAWGIGIVAGVALLGAILWKMR